MNDPIDAGPAAAADAARVPNPDPGPSAQVLEMRFVGSGSEYFRIWIVNLLLTLVTLGFYYPFAKARRLRYFHGATELGGHPFAFHADPWKMFRGYLLVGLMFAAYSGAGQFSPTAGLIAFVIVAALWPALWHSSMRFRLANTSWRGLRLRYSGRRGQAYAVWAMPLAVSFLSIGGLLLVGDVPDPEAPPAPPGLATWLVLLLPPLALVLVMPAFLWLLKRLQHRHYGWGGESTRFEVGPVPFYGLALKSLGVGIVAAIAVFGLAALLLFVVGGSGGGRPGPGSVIVITLSVMLAYLLLFSIAGGYFTARAQNLVWNGTRSESVEFTSRLSARALATLWLKNLCLVVVTIGLYFPFAQVASARLRLEAVRVRVQRDPAEMAARAEALDESAAGDAAGDLFGIDIGL